jgi:hypothetical protein
MRSSGKPTIDKAFFAKKENALVPQKLQAKHIKPRHDLVPPQAAG